MSKAIIRLTCRQVIGPEATTDFEKNVLLATYQEFLLKSQAYNPDSRLKTFSEMKNNDGRANSLHYKLSFTIGHFIESLQNRIPVMTDVLGNSIIFETPQLELIESDTTNKSAHKVAINYITSEFTLLKTMGKYMVLTNGDNHDTFTVRMQDGLSISSYREVGTHVVSD